MSRHDGASMYFDPNFRDDIYTEMLWQRAMAPLALPFPGRYGSLSVVQESTYGVPLYQEYLVFSTPLILTLLYEGTTLWMSDTPQERLMMRAGAEGMYGYVLVGGGGLGLFTQYLLEQDTVERVTVVERHPDVVSMLRSTWGDDSRLEVVHALFEEYISSPARPFDCCYIDIHPTIDPRWLPWLNWLRDRCAALVKGPLRIWGYHWMARELVEGVERGYLPWLRRGLVVDTPLGRNVARVLPDGWRKWPERAMHEWLVDYSRRVSFHFSADSRIPSVQYSTARSLYSSTRFPSGSRR